MIEKEEREKCIKPGRGRGGNTEAYLIRALITHMDPPSVIEVLLLLLERKEH